VAVTRAADDGGPHRQIATLSRLHQRGDPRCHVPRSPAFPGGEIPAATPLAPPPSPEGTPFCHAPSLPRRPRRGLLSATPPRSPRRPRRGPLSATPPRSPAVPGGDIHSQAVHRHPQAAACTT
jgi:hypothetical protein